ILELNPQDQGGGYAIVEPGIVLDQLIDAAEKHQLTFAPDPATHNRCTLGGMIGNNACGTHSIMGGKTVDNVLELDILLYDGTRMTVGATTSEEFDAIIQAGGRKSDIYKSLQQIANNAAELVRKQFPEIPRRVSGYNLDELLPENNFNVARALVGTEGTCAIVLSAKLKLMASPQHRVLVALNYPDIYLAADDSPRLLKFPGLIALEGVQGETIDILRGKNFAGVELVPPGGGLLLAEFGADSPEAATALAQTMIDTTQQLPTPPNIRIYTTPAEIKQIWYVREGGPRASNHTHDAPLLWEGWEDAAVAPENLGQYLRELRKLLDEFDYQSRYYGHFGHGCIHMQVNFDLLSDPGIQKFQQFLERATELVVSHGGSLSGEHGDGQARAALYPKMFSPELLRAFKQFKTTFDPTNKMNPGKLVDPYLPTENLRLGIDYNPMKVDTKFRYPDDHHDFHRAILRCEGLGRCRQTQAGTMCPSYRATLEEQHSTRGRARMLFEMLQQEVVTDGWTDQHVKESLDLCLSCKACKTECPVNVDIPTYKAEFLSHYYEKKRRPLSSYAFGRIDFWLHLASFAPRLANFCAGLPGVDWLVKTILHLHHVRKLPRLANKTFRQWWKSAHPSRDREGVTKTRVLLWTDTFTNHLAPEVAIAAIKVLKHAGFEPAILPKQICCGRPLYDFGMLDVARRYLQKVLAALNSEINAGTPIIVLEPSCASVFRDELINLMPENQQAQKLSKQTFLLTEFLTKHNYIPPRLERTAMLHNHCHQKALKVSDAGALLRKMGLTVTTPDSGCCGMAGSFGFKAANYEVSQKIANAVLLPTIAKMPEDALLIADGFSCREQIHQNTGKPALHTAQVLAMAITT
ncbi:MAG: FAD-binding protein, partial [Phycisphaerales bacterium]|nr:FAD-binding protein [Phycisphaerales bacterium]